MRFEVTNPLPWVLGSAALAVAATNLAWLATRTHRRGSRLPGEGIWVSLEPLAWLVWALFLFLVPVAAWWAGALSPYLMGLSQLDWVGTLVSGGLVAAAIAGTTIFGWLVYRHNLPAEAGRDGATRYWLAPIDSALLQWHWAFYRAGLIGWLTAFAGGITAGPLTFLAPVTRSPLYWGSWLGMVLVAMEWALNPFARTTLIGAGRNAPSPTSRERTVIRMVLAVATTALFILTRNFWLLLGCHVIVETAIFVFLAVPSIRPAEE